MDKSTDWLIIARISHFYKHESCGQAHRAMKALVGCGVLWSELPGQAKPQEIDALLLLQSRLGHTIWRQ